MVNDHRLAFSLFQIKLRHYRQSHRLARFFVLRYIAANHPGNLYMSQILIQQYLNQLQDLRKVSGTHREMVVREAFKDLLKGWARSHDLIFVPEYEIATPAKDRRYVDGALVHALRVPFGYWEAKDEKDDLDAEIELKKRRGYPQDNIIFEDSNRAVLVQEKEEVYRCPVDDVKGLENY
jgi:hypothetical protein